MNTVLPNLFLPNPGYSLSVTLRIYPLAFQYKCIFIQIYHGILTVKSRPCYFVQGPNNMSDNNIDNNKTASARSQRPINAVYNLNKVKLYQDTNY